VPIKESWYKNNTTLTGGTSLSDKPNGPGLQEQSAIWIQSTILLANTFLEGLGYVMTKNP
jgi:hypothetical protein